MFGVALKVSAGSKERNEGGGGLAPPVILSVDSNLSVCNDQPPGFSGVGFEDCLTLGGGAIDPALTEYLYTHYADGTGAGDTNPPAFPGAAWTAYTGTIGDRSVEWDQFGNENGPLIQPTAAGPYIGQDPWFDGKNDPIVLSGDGGASWKRLIITVKNAAGQDSAEIFYQDDCF